MTKLTDTQAVLLSSASRRPNRSVLPLPASLAGGTRTAKPLAGLLTRGLAEERATSVPEEVHRTDGDTRLGLYITAAGEAAIGVVEEQEQEIDAGEPQPESVAPRRTKAALVLGLLTREHGATLADLIAATGWLPHTTRAALTGLRKKGHDVQRGKRDGVTFYTVVSVAPAASVASTAEPR